MGHLGHLKADIGYETLLKRLEAGTVALPRAQTDRANAGRQEILEILYTKEQAALAARLPVKPAGLGKIAARVGLSPEELKPKLDAMAEKGLVLDLVHPKTGEVRYLLAPPVVGFFEFSLMRVKDSIPKKRMAEALEAYTHGDDTFAREVFGYDTVIGRAMVSETALSDEQLPDVLEWERVTSVLEEAHAFSVSMCYCRHKAEHLGERCDAPMDVCLSINGGAEFVTRRGFGRAIDRHEALDIVTAARERGLVQIADNVMDRPSYICNCCACCCGQLLGIHEFGLQAVNPSGFEARADAEACVGCSRCSRACPVGAITMAPVRTAAKRKNDLLAEVDADRCIGCGVCGGACRKDAMKMVRREKQPYVPKNVIERVVRMSLERGRLPHLLFDEGHSRGSRFLNRALQVLCRLPIADRILASEQLRSRFVRFALGHVADPTG